MSFGSGMIREYEVVWDDDLIRFEEEVNWNIKQGYILQGGICIRSDEGGEYFYQAMYREREQL